MKPVSLSSHASYLPWVPERQPLVAMASLAHFQFGYGSVCLQVPAWPFVVGSFAFGIFALGPFFALWTPVTDKNHKQMGPPAKKDLVSHCLLLARFEQQLYVCGSILCQRETTWRNSTLTR